MLAEKILAYCDKKHWSERQFAIEVGIAPEQINRYINGKNKPTRKTWDKIRAALPDFDPEINDQGNTNLSIKLKSYDESLIAKDELIATQRETISILISANKALKEKVAEMEKKLSQH